MFTIPHFENIALAESIFSEQLELGLLWPSLISISFATTFYILPKWIQKANEIGLVWEDVHKIGHPKNIAGSGGVAVLAGFVLAVFLYIGINTFIFNTQTNLIETLTLLTTVIYGWKTGGLKKRTRILTMGLIAIPLIVINPGESILLGVDFGLFYPLFLIPFAVIGVTTTFNFLAGFNGLEASQGIILLTALSIVNITQGNEWLALLGMSFVGALLGFWLFNKCPAKVFPGDILTYSTGAMIVSVIILGNIEKIAVFFFIPYIIEMFLKLRGQLEVQSFGAVQKDGSLKLRQKGIYGLGHVAIVLLRKIKPSGNAYEWEVTLIINLLQLVFVVSGFILFL